MIWLKLLTSNDMESIIQTHDFHPDLSKKEKFSQSSTWYYSGKEMHHITGDSWEQ